MILTSENYHSVEARKKYLSASRYKDFCGSLGIVPCEDRSIAIMKEEWVEETTPAMKVSSYVDAHFAGTLGVFKSQNPEILTQKGELRSEYKHMNNVISRIERDDYFMRFMSGEKQIIMTAEFFGIEWSIMIDSYIPDVAIVDLKVMADLRKSHWAKDWGRMSFVQYYGYLEQAAIYSKVVEINTGKRLPFFIAGASKEPEPAIDIIGFTQRDLDDTMSLIEPNISRIIKLKNGEVEPDRCGICDWCKYSRVLSRPLHFSELLLKI